MKKKKIWLIFAIYLVMSFASGIADDVLVFSKPVGGVEYAAPFKDVVVKKEHKQNILFTGFEHGTFGDYLNNLPNLFFRF